MFVLHVVFPYIQTPKDLAGALLPSRPSQNHRNLHNTPVVHIHITALCPVRYSGEVDRQPHRPSYGSNADTPQFRGGNPYFFNENPYQSVSFIYASMYRESVHAIHIPMQFSRHCVIKIDSYQQRTRRDSRIRPRPYASTASD